MRIRDLRCTVCGSPDLVAVRAGQDARRHPVTGELMPETKRPDIAWCVDHWPALRRAPETTAA